MQFLPNAGISGFQIRLLVVVVALFLCLYAAWTPVEYFVLLMVSRGQILTSGAIAVKLGFLLAYLLLVYVLLNTHFVRNDLKPFIDRRPAVVPVIVLGAVAVFFLSRFISTYLAELVLGGEQNQFNMDTYLHNPWQRAITLLFPELLILVLYFRVLHVGNQFVSWHRRLLSPPQLFIFFVYGSMWLVVSATIRSLFAYGDTRGLLAYAACYYAINILIARFAKKSPGIICAWFNLPAVLVEVTANSTYSIFEELGQYPVGIYTLLLVIPAGYVLGRSLSWRLYRST